MTDPGENPSLSSDGAAFSGSLAFALSASAGAGSRFLLSGGVGCVRVVRAAVNVGDDAARLAQDDGGAGDVPDVVVEGPVAVEAAGGDVSEVQRRRAGPPQRLRLERQVAPPLQRLLVAAQIGREAGREQGRVEGGDF